MIKEGKLVVKKVVVDTRTEAEKRIEAFKIKMEAKKRREKRELRKKLAALNQIKNVEASEESSIATPHYSSDLD